MHNVAINDQEFARFQRFILDAAGIQLSAAKKVLVSSRLGGRLRARAVASFGEYFRLIMSRGEDRELQTAVDLLTTNETYFFREPKHFEFLRRLLHDRAAATTGGRKSFRVWSAAASSGEEAYSVAMLLTDILGAGPWEVLASDISVRILDKARAGHYPLARAQYVPAEYLRRFCRKGIGPEEGTLLIEPHVRERVRFEHINLTQAIPEIGEFDVVFLRNVLIYFGQETKADVIARLRATLRPGGHLLVGHSETLNGIAQGLQSIAPAIYRKSDRT